MVARGAAAAAAIALALTLLPATAVAHTTDELEAWLGDWAARTMNNGALSTGLLDEYVDMAARHPRYFGRPVPYRRAVNSATPLASNRPPPRIEDWRPLVSRYFAAADVAKALRVIACESTNDASAKNPRSSASGLWQHLAKYWASRSAAAGIPGASIWDPEASTIVAAWLVYADTGWGHWPRCGRL